MAQANPDPTQSRTELSTDTIHTFADIERQLRANDAVGRVEARATGSSARVHFDTAEYNPSSRERLTAGIATKVCHSDNWQLVSIHDPMELPDSHMVSSAITIRAADGGRR